MVAIHVQKKFGIRLLLIQLEVIHVVDVSHGFRRTEDIVNGMLVLELAMSLLTDPVALYVIKQSATV